MKIEIPLSIKGTVLYNKFNMNLFILITHGGERTFSKDQSDLANIQLNFSE